MTQLLTKQEIAQRVADSKIRVSDYRRIVKFLRKTGLDKIIIEKFFDRTKAEPKGINDWAILRTKTDITYPELLKLKEEYGTDIARCLTEKYPHLLEDHPLEVRKKDGTEVIADLLNIFLDILDHDEHYQLLVDLLSSIYDIPAEQIEDLSIEELTVIAEDLMSSADFIKP